MADSASPAVMSQTQVPAPAPAPLAEEGGSPQLDGVEEDDLDVDHDDAQSFLQPAISPLATLLTSPRAPVADKVAALGRQPGLHETQLGETISQSGQVLAASDNMATDSEGGPDQRPSPVSSPSQWQAGQRQSLIFEPGRLRSSMTAALQSHSRQHRSQSAGESALKRLSKVLPNFSIPSNLIPNISTPTFFSSGSGSPQKDEHGSEARPPSVLLTASPPPNGPIRADTAPIRTLRHSASDDSLLYNTLSRVSSLGDDERFAHVREQVNVRIKAIKDSFEGPSFRLPQMPSKSSSVMHPPPWLLRAD